MLRWPAAAVGGLLCTYGLEQWSQAHSSFTVQHDQLTNVATAVIVVVAIFVRLMRGKGIWKNYPPVGWVVLGLYGLAFISFLWSVSREWWLIEWLKDWPYIGAFVLLAPLAVLNEDDLRDALYALMALGGVICVLLLTTVSFKNRSVQFAGMVNYASTGNLGNPLAIASLAGYVALTAMLLNFQGVTRFWQLMRWGLVATALVLVVRSGSRGQFYAFLLAGVPCLLISRRPRNMGGFIASIIGIVLLLSLAMWTFDAYADRDRFSMDTMFSDMQGGRIERAKAVLSYWADSSPIHWLVGLGSSSSFDTRINSYFPEVIPAEILAEEGLVGFSLFIAMLVMSARAVKRIYAAVAPYPRYRGMLAALAGLMFFEFILSFKQGNMLGFQMLFTFAIVLGRFQAAILKPQQYEVADDEPQLSHQLGGYPYASTGRQVG